MPSTHPLLKPTGIIVLSILAFLLPIAFIEYSVLQDTHGTLAYPIDDTFIHLAIAKNIALYYNWGINAHDFVSASSSIIYPVILATAVKIAGPVAVIPLLVNISAGVALIIVVQRWLQRQAVLPTAQLLILLAMIILTPLPVLAIAGMEHVLQILFCFLFLTSFAGDLERGLASGQPKWQLSWKVYLYGALFTATRYEAIPMIGFAAIGLLLCRRYLSAVQLVLYSLLPIFLFGIFSLYHGNYFFPNSVLLKSGMPPMTMDGLIDFFTDTLYIKLSYSIVGYNTIATQRILLLLPLSYLVFIRQMKPGSAYRSMLLILTASVLLHLSITGYAHFPRYEAYLIGVSSLVLGVVLAKYTGKVWTSQRSAFQYIAVFTLILLVFPVFMRSKTAFGEMRQACVNIFEQQYQMGQFLHQYYYNEKAAIGDIGAVSYLTAGNIIDLVGLANINIARSRREHYNSPDFLDYLTKKEAVKIAVVYDVFNYPALLSRWNKIATWKIPNNVACGDDIVSFYAVDQSAGPLLKSNLLAFQPLLPKEVVVKYY